MTRTQSSLFLAVKWLIMRKKLGIAVALFVGTLYVLGQPPKFTSRVSTHTPQSAPIIAQPGQPNQTEPHRDPPERKPSESVRWWGKPDWWVLIVAAITGGLIAYQSRATQRAANASLLNAQALVDSERPWLIAEPIANERNSRFYELRITNFGRTPARFIRGDAKYVHTTRPDMLPTPPTYSSPIILPKNLVIAPNRSFSIPHGYDIIHLLDNGGGPDKTLVIYGRVIYEDTLIPGKEHEVAWCFGYIYAPNALGLLEGDFVLTGPSEYTRNN